MTNSQTAVICACILSTSAIDLLYRENEKAPARKAEQAAQAEKKFQDDWSSAKNGLRYLNQTCRDYYHDTNGKRGDVAEFQRDASLWLSLVTNFVDAYPKSREVETTSLKGFVQQMQPAISSPSDESIRAAWVLVENACKQFSIE